MKLHDLIIIGAGPAGMTAAIYAARAGLDPLLLEGHFPGGKMSNTDRVENWPGTKSISGADLATQMFEHCSELNVVPIFTGVNSLTPDNEYFNVNCDVQTFKGRSVIVATGTVERKLGIPGEADYQGKGISYCAVCDGAFFKDKNTVVIGGGNSAYEDAIYLSRFSKKVDLVLRRDVPRADRINVQAVNNTANIEVHYNLTPTEFLGNNEQITGVRFKASHGTEERVLRADGVFPMVGLIANTDLLKGLPILNAEGFVETDNMMSTSIPGLFAAGDVRNTPLRQIVTAAGDASIAVQSAMKYIDKISI